MDELLHYLHEVETAGRIVGGSLVLWVDIPGVECKPVTAEELRDQDGCFAVYAAEKGLELQEADVDRLIDEGAVAWLGDVDGDDRGVLCGNLLSAIYG